MKIKRKKRKGGGMNNSGANNPFYGKHHSEESRRKMRESHLGVKLSEEHRRKLGLAHCGLKHTEETKRKCSLTKIGNLNPMYGKHLSEEHRHKIKISNIGKHYLSKEAIDKLRRINRGKGPIKKGQKLSYNHRKHISISHTGIHHTDKVKTKLSNIQKKKWQDPNYAKNQAKLISDGLGICFNKSEKQLNKILNKLFPGEYRFVGNGEIWINGRNPDFININGQKKIIELFGDYWHSKKITGLKKKEHQKQRQEHFAKYGYKTLVVWGHELRDKRKLKERIKLFTG